MNKTPDTFVALAICPWREQTTELLEATHGEMWHEEIDLSLSLDEEGDELWGRGTAIFPDGVQAELLVEPPLPEVVGLAGLSPIPFTPMEMILLQEHKSVWRISVDSGPRIARRGAKRITQLFATFVDAGAIGIFLPGIARLHAPRMIQQESMDLFSPQSLAQLFVSAFHKDEWMRTRGMTAFGLPEVELKITQGLNGAFFDLMDVATNMLLQMSPFPDGSRVQVGHRTLQVTHGPERVPDDELPVNGVFGVVSVQP